MEEISIEVIKERLLKVFKFTIKFLEDHNFHYVAGYGTVLGAVRHKGFIPWDDDIDIHLPRKEYDRLLTMGEEMQKQGYDIQSINQLGYYLPFAKIIDNNTTIWEEERYPYITGIYVDIFPLDSFDISNAKLWRMQAKSMRLFRRYQIAIHPFTKKKLLYDFKHIHPIRVKIHLEKKLCKNVAEKYLNKFKRFQDKYSAYSGEKCVCVTSTKGLTFRREWFEDPVYLDFEDIKIKVPKDYKAYLTLLYGDYMQLPPEDKRRSEHKRVYMNLDKKMTLEEVKKEINYKISI